MTMYNRFLLRILTFVRASNLIPMTELLTVLLTAVLTVHPVLADEPIVNLPPELVSPSVIPSVIPSAVTPRGMPSTLYVVIGGNGTCTVSHPSPLFHNLQSNSLFTGFESWLVKPGYLTPQDNVIFACYEWLSPMMRFYDVRYQPLMTSIHEGQLDVLVLSRSYGMARVVVIGHSHGGWRAIKLAASPYLAAHLTMPITLVSIDPVSRITCLKLRESGCREAPRDLSWDEMNYLNSRVRWLNAYQDNGIFLNSGAMTAAHANIPVISNHVAIQTNVTVWQAVVSWVTAL